MITCWTCGRPLHNDNTIPGAGVTITHHARGEYLEHLDEYDDVTRETCSTTCARKACTWTPSDSRVYHAHTTTEGTQANTT